MTSPNIVESAELEETERIETVYAVDKKFSVVDKNGNEKTYVILDHEIKELHSQALLDDIAYICAYFPTAITETKQIGKEKISITDWKNQGYFIINSYQGIKQLRRQIKPIDDTWLKSNFKINVLPNSNPRWRYEDMMEWKKSREPTDPKELFEVLMKTIKKYIDFDDEAAHFKLLDDRVIYDALEPNIANTEGDFICISTPNGRRGFFYDLWCEENEYYKLVQPYTVSYGLLLSESYVNSKKNDLRIDFEQEFNCQFTTSQNAAFPSGFFTAETLEDYELISL